MNKYTQTEFEQLAPGTDVRNNDGGQIGIVGETVGNYVELRSISGSTYWIRRNQFGESQHEGVLLGLTDEEFPEHALTELPNDALESADVGVLGEDRDDQRELMLEDLAEQRAEMREEGRATEEADDNVGIPVEEELAQRHQS